VSQLQPALSSSALHIMTPSELASIPLPPPPSNECVSPPPPSIFIDPALISALSVQSTRIHTLKTEDKVLKFVQGKQKSISIGESFTPFQRLLLHKVCDRFGVERVKNEQDDYGGEGWRPTNGSDNNDDYRRNKGYSVKLKKAGHCKIPGTLLIDIGQEELSWLMQSLENNGGVAVDLSKFDLRSKVSDASVVNGGAGKNNDSTSSSSNNTTTRESSKKKPVKMLKVKTKANNEEGNNVSGYCAADGTKSKDGRKKMSDDKRRKEKKTIDDREKEYAEARRRILGQENDDSSEM